MNTTGFRYHIGIDPGTNTGVAMWDKKAQRLTFVGSMMAVEAEEFVDSMVAKHFAEGVMVHVEDTRNLKMPKGSVEERGPNAMKNMGQVIRDMSRWEQYLQHKGHTFVMRPLTKSQLRKCTDEFFRRVTGWNQRTNEHGRDGAAYVYGI